MVSLALLFGVGISFVMQNALANTLLQIITPDAVRGRVMSIYTLTFQASMRLGGLQAGLAADAIGAPLAVSIGAMVSLGYGCRRCGSLAGAALRRLSRWKPVNRLG